jgi:hypothetical protein
LSPQWFSTIASQEKKGLERSDLIIAIREEDRIFFESLVDRKVITVGYITPLGQHKDFPVKKQKHILFIGSANSINVDAINFFLETTFPIIKMAYPETKLCLAGNIGNLFKDKDDCIAIGETDSLEKIYSSADIIINPVRTGTGLSIKSIEALGFAKALVSTTKGARGIENGAGKAFLVADRPEYFSYHVIRLFKDRKFAFQLSNEAYLYAKSWNEKNLKVLRKELISKHA